MSTRSKKYKWLVFSVVLLVFAGCSKAQEMNSVEPTEESTEDIHTHVYEETLIAATCETKEFKTYVCECGEQYSETISEALGHTFGEWYIEQSVDVEEIEETIMEVRECENCGFKETKEHVHVYVLDENTALDATCENAGKEADEICACGDVITGAGIAVIGHAYQVIEGTSSSPTCVEVGKEADQKCANCGSVITGAVIGAEGHSWGDYMYNNDATTAADGSKTHKCRDCGATETSVAEGTKLTDWKALTIKEVNEYGWVFYTDSSGTEVCGSGEAYKSFLSSKYPQLTVCEEGNYIWAE